MTQRWFAESLDRAFVRFCIRPTLPAITRNSPLVRLQLAESRMESGVQDEDLFPEQLGAECDISSSRSLTGGRRELVRRWLAPQVPLESDWFPDSPRIQSVTSKWYLRDAPRPLLILVRGWGPHGAFATSLLGPMRALDQIGYDIVIPNLAVNTHQAFGNPFPGQDPCRNIVEIARAASMLGQVLLLARNLGHDSILVWGTSLGAHIAALLATLPVARLADRYILEKPLGRISDPMRFHGRVEPALLRQIADRLDGVYRAVSPLDRIPTVDPRRVTVIGSEFDRVTLPSAAQAVARHFCASQIQVKASHLFDLDRVPRLKQIMLRSGCSTNESPDV